MQTNSAMHRVSVRELDVSKAVKDGGENVRLDVSKHLSSTVSHKTMNCIQSLPLRMSREPVTQDSDSVDRTTPVEMDLQLICSSSVVYLRSGHRVRSDASKEKTS